MSMFFGLFSIFTKLREKNFEAPLWTFHIFFHACKKQISEHPQTCQFFCTLSLIFVANFR